MAGTLGRGVYATRAWRSLSAACKAAAGGLCADCGSFGFECHHKIPLYLGGPELPGLAGVAVAVPVVSFSAAPVAVAHVMGRTARSLAVRLKGGARRCQPRGARL